MGMKILDNPFYYFKIFNMAKITFQVHLENVELSRAQLARLEKEIHSVVASHVVKTVPAETPLGIKLKINPEWLGIWLKKFKSLEDLKGNTDFKKFNVKVQ